jgi:hypothetical protein
MPLCARHTNTVKLLVWPETPLPVTLIEIVVLDGADAVQTLDEQNPDTMTEPRVVHDNEAPVTDGLFGRVFEPELS